MKQKLKVVRRLAGLAAGALLAAHALAVEEQPPEIGTRMPDGTVYAGLSMVTGKPEFVRAAGGTQPDGTIYAGVSPDTDRPLYTTPRDASAPMPWSRALHYCRALSAHGHHDWRVPSLTELAVLFSHRSDIGGFNETGLIGNQPGYYWTSLEVTDATAWGQRFNDGYHDDFSKQRNSLLRCVRSAPP
jgi:hypothetical protein